MRHIYGETFSEIPPTPTLKIYDLLADFVSDSNLHQEALEDAYKMLEHTQGPLRDELSTYAEKGLLSRQDVTFMVVLAASSRTVGPDLAMMFFNLATGNFAAIDEVSISRLDMDTRIKLKLGEIIGNLKRI